MLKHNYNPGWARSAARSSQRGVVMILALVVLVALTLAAVALTRSVSTSNAIAGNLSFQQAATHSADRGIEAAVAWLEANNKKDQGKCTLSLVLACNQLTDGYQAARAEPETGKSWDAFFDQNVKDKKVKELPDDEVTKRTDNKVSYLIQRMCATEGDVGTGLNPCASTPVASPGTCPGGTTCTGGGGRGGTGGNLSTASQTYYRITVRVSGPRNTQSLVQATVAL